MRDATSEAIRRINSGTAACRALGVPLYGFGSMRQPFKNIDRLMGDPGPDRAT